VARVVSSAHRFESRDFQRPPNSKKEGSGFWENRLIFLWFLHFDDEFCSMYYFEFFLLKNLKMNYSFLDFFISNFLNFSNLTSRFSENRWNQSRPVFKKSAGFWVAFQSIVTDRCAAPLILKQPEPATEQTSALFAARLSWGIPPDPAGRWPMIPRRERTTTRHPCPCAPLPRLHCS
jgi:hypothetical protein